MAVSTPVLATPGVGATASMVTTASFTPTADAILIAFAMSRGSGAEIPDSISDSLGGTWTPIAAGQDAGFVAGRLWYQEVGASPAARTVTTTIPAGSQTALAIVEVTGASTDFSNYNFDITTGTSQTVNLSPYSAGSMVLAGVIDNAGASSSFPGPFTELYDANLATNTRSSIAYESGATATTSINITTGSSDNYAWGLEIKEASGTPAQTINGALYTDTDTFFGATVSPGPVTIAGSLFANSNAFYTAVVSQAGAPQQIDGGLFTNTPQFFSATLTSVVRINAQLYNDPDQFFAATITVAGGGGGDSGAEYIILRRRRR